MTPSRKTYRLTADEAAAFPVPNALWPDAGLAFRFWATVAAARGLDYRSIIGNPLDRESFTALPLGHGKHWCWPASLRCHKPPPEFVIRDAAFA